MDNRSNRLSIINWRRETKRGEPVHIYRTEFPSGSIKTFRCKLLVRAEEMFFQL